MAEYIEREAALLSLTPIVKRASERNRNVYSAVKQCVEAINWCTSADVAPVRHGRWLAHRLDNSYTTWTCSVCGTIGVEAFHYCPNCGAKMDGGET